MSTSHRPPSSSTRSYASAATADAATVAVDFISQATAKGQPWALARAARCSGLLADAGELESCFEEALTLHERTPDAFEAARTRLAYGARLRCVRKRIRAREELRAAVAIFERLGARPWADQADAELAATPGHVYGKLGIHSRDELASAFGASHQGEE